MFQLFYGKLMLFSSFSTLKMFVQFQNIIRAPIYPTIYHYRVRLWDKVSNILGGDGIVDCAKSEP